MKLRSLTKQRGLNLIELMIAIVIGLFISLLAVQYLSTSSRLFKQQGVDSNLEANGTFAISYLSQFIRQAGTYNPTGTDVPFYVGSCGDAGPCTTDKNAVGESDRIAVQMVPANNRDCVDNPVPTGSRIANVFSVREGTLFCRGYDVSNEDWLVGDEVALIDGVEQLQVLYGVSNSQGQVDRYVNASNVPAADASDIEVQEAWDRVRSVKVAVLVSDDANTGTLPKSSRSFGLLDASVISYDDRISRKVYSTTIHINNKMP